jgi:hypothetical protein
VNINFNVKVRAGPRTPVGVDVYSTSSKEKALRFANGVQVTETQIADWLHSELSRVLRQLQDGPAVEVSKKHDKTKNIPPR